MPIEKEKITQLEKKAYELRRMALTMIHAAKSGHPGGSFSAAEIMAVLYFNQMNLDPKNPKWEDRDRFVLSKGHVCPILYSSLILRDFLPETEVYNLRKYGSVLQGHPDMKKCPGIDISTGSLGQGISCAVGMAVAAKMDKKDYKTYTLLGDGECNEGQVWEAVQCAVKYKLDNLVVILDNNNLQNDGTCDEVMPTGDLAKKVEAFGMEIYKVDGHSVEELLCAFEKINDNFSSGKPKCIIAKTVKGKGVSFMENVPGWHGMAPNDEEFSIAMKELGEKNDN
ncbi:MAG: transketolase [Spirochaetales bacterium]